MLSVLTTVEWNKIKLKNPKFQKQNIIQNMSEIIIKLKISI